MNYSDQDVTEVSDSTCLTSNPTVTVVVLTYNHAKYLSDSIDSIAIQHCSFGFEILIMEDCSTDDTRSVAIECQKKYPESVRVIFGAKNIGTGANFQRAMDHSRGRYIALCEGDDQWQDSGKLQKQVDYLETHKDVVVTYHDAMTIDEKGETISHTKLSSNIDERDFTGEQLQMGMHLPTLTMCFRKVITSLPKEFYPVVNQDKFLISMLGAYGGAKFLGDIKPAIYRVHEGGVWSTLSCDEKSIRHITTFYWLSVYHKNQSNEHIASVHACTAIRYLLSQLHVEKFGLLKLFVKWLLKK